MISVENAESYFKNKIGKDSDDIRKVWERFKDSCKETVQGEEEKENLFQCGVYDFTGEELFHLDFVRQFTVYEEDKYSRMEQLHCEFLFKPTDELNMLETAERSMDFDDVDDFFNHIENLQEFKIPLTLKPIKLEIYQNEV
ncbi:hypothetical protein DRW41_00410 [Neobacillus piezotolerans]|uniref:Uncharacterized protein n=1 Tax=Neobacillus piezotolerans TaxID=2259171 RepID=A0A3D8GUC9_9BACI|nr:hypothetical protein [Neobacillus piezotolerans]RDU38073.1 hypothetical protein DRW41_00410 [Neobacillus piezotolerans]